MILVTGGAGFIGSNLVAELNARGRTDIWVVDDLEQGDKFQNIAGAQIADYTDKDDFAELMVRGDSSLDSIDAILHQGACSDTTVHDGRLMMRTNYSWSKALLQVAQSRGIPMVYASSAAVYGGSDRFVEEPACEAPLNVYGYSKLLFDQHVRRVMPSASSQIVGLRYFNVYGPQEQHKGPMASVAWQFHNQLLDTGGVRLFEGTGGYGPGEQRRDFVYVGDIVKVNLWFLEHPDRSGIFNVGTGVASTFNSLARAVIGFHGRGELGYVPFPESLAGRYQSFTEADIQRLRAAGYDAQFRSVEQGVSAYLGSVAEATGG
jgi:ADP-L-glycero-D-manno-heptose 6-epimerase